MVRASVVGSLIWVLIAAGCTGEGGERDRADLNALSVYYLDYARSNRTPPANEQVLRQYIEAVPVELRQQLNAEDVDSLFVSPRDGKPYVVIYGEATRGEIPDVFAYEQDGADGKRWVARSLGYVREFEDGEFQELIASKP